MISTNDHPSSVNTEAYEESKQYQRLGQESPTTIVTTHARDSLAQITEEEHQFETEQRTNEMMLHSRIMSANQAQAQSVLQNASLLQKLHTIADSRRHLMAEPSASEPVSEASLRSSTPRQSRMTVEESKFEVSPRPLSEKVDYGTQTEDFAATAFYYSALYPEQIARVAAQTTDHRQMPGDGRPFRH